MSSSVIIDKVVEPAPGAQCRSASRLQTSTQPHRLGGLREYQLLTEYQLLSLIHTPMNSYDADAMVAAGDYSADAFILRTAAHNHMVHENIPPGSCVMLDPRAEVGENAMMAYALLDQNVIAIGVRDDSWDGYFISLGDRAVHITSKRCKPLWPAVAVVGYEL